MIQHEKLLCGVEKVNVQYRPCTEKGLSSEFFFFLYTMAMMLSLKCCAERCRLIHAEFLSSTDEVTQLNLRLNMSSQ